MTPTFLSLDRWEHDTIWWKWKTVQKPWGWSAEGANGKQEFCFEHMTWKIPIRYSSVDIICINKVLICR